MSNITINEFGTPSIAINNIIFRTANSTLVGDTKTLITYSSDGLVIRGEDATTDDIEETVNRKYVTEDMLNLLTSLLNQTTNTNIFYPHIQDIPSDTWIVDHNISGIIDVDIFDYNGLRVIGSYEIIDFNTIHILLEDSMVGYVYVYKKKDYSNITYPIQTTLLSNNQIIAHNLNGIVTLKAFNEYNQEVLINYQLLDSDNILLLLEDSFNGFLKIFKID